MNAARINFKKLVLTVVLTLASLLTACSEESSIFSPTGSGYSSGNGSEDMPAGGITVTVRKHQSGRGYVFDLQNNSVDTIVNDFHVIFDSTVKITGWNVGRNWQIDPTSTDTGKGKFGIKSGPNGQPIPPGQVAENLLWVEVKFTSPSKKNPRQWWDFKWQATRDGVVVKEGLAAYPN
jgi:hypothetical protein